MAAVAVIVLSFASIALAPAIAGIPVLGPMAGFLANYGVALILLSSFVIGILYYRIVGGLLAVLGMFVILWSAGLLV